MIDRDHELPIKRQAALLSMSRGSVYDHPEPVSADDLRLMRRIDELHLEYPFAGSRMLRDMLRLEVSTSSTLVKQIASFRSSALHRLATRNENLALDAFGSGGTPSPDSHPRKAVPHCRLPVTARPVEHPPTCR